MRVSTFTQYNTSLSQLQTSNSSLSDLAYQITSGYKGSTLQDYAKEANQLLTLRDFTSSSNIYINNIDKMSTRLKATEDALESMQELLLEASSLRTQANSETSPEARAAMAPEAQGIAESIYAILNTQYEGRYLFSGQASEDAPTTQSATANPATGLPAPTTYYTGATERQQSLVSSGTLQSYGATGDNEAFANAIAGIEALWYGLENDSDTDIQGAIQLLEAAEDSLNNLVGEIGGAINGLNLTKDRHENAILFTNERIDSLEKVDVSEALTQYAQMQTQLEASMTIMTEMSSLSLLDFMR